jgi:S1-C subfamily serine protease
MSAVAKEPVRMARPSFWPLVVVVSSLAAAAQAPSVLHIRVTLGGAGQMVTPVAGHRLLISDNPATAPPREVVTAGDGTVDVRLPPGNYTVESDEPFVSEGKAYTWTQTLDVPAGRDATLELTSANADTAADDSMSPPARVVSRDAAAAGILAQWQDSVVELWTATAHGSGFVVDASGWIATNQRVVGEATSVEVQVSRALKMAGTVVAAQPGRDVAVIRIDPAALASIPPLALPCSSLPQPPPTGQKVFTIGAPLRQAKSVSYGILGRVGPHALETDLDLEPGSAGGPAFDADGTVLGVTSVVDGSDERRPDYRVVRVGDVCAVIASAQKLAKDAAPPRATQLPVEPARPFPPDALEAIAKQHAGSRAPYLASSSDFDVAFITPGLIYAARHQTRPSSLPSRTMGTRMPDPEAELRARALLDFGRWSDYVADYPPVLLVRVTPRLVEGFWKMVARGAAQTQGVSLPAMKHFKTGFARLQAFCGDTEVTPIHPFRLERPVSDTSTIDEGLYVFDPGALAPGCGSVRLVLYSQKSPDSGETLTVDSKLLEQVWHDFAAYRDAR